jgi:hypothetical protein
MLPGCEASSFAKEAGSPEKKFSFASVGDGLETIGDALLQALANNKVTIKYFNFIICFP